MSNCGIFSKLLSQKQKSWIDDRAWFWTSSDLYAEWLEYNRNFTNPELKSERDHRISERVESELVSDTKKEFGLGPSVLKNLYESLETQMRMFALDPARRDIIKSVERDSSKLISSLLKCYSKTSSRATGNGMMDFYTHKASCKTLNQVAVVEKLKQIWFNEAETIRFKEHLSFLSLVECSLQKALFTCPDPRLKKIVHSVYPFIAELGVGLVSGSERLGKLLVYLVSKNKIKLVHHTHMLLESELNDALELRQTSGFNYTARVEVDEVTWRWKIFFINLKDSTVSFTVQVMFTYPNIWEDVLNTSEFEFTESYNKATQCALSSYKQLIREFFLLNCFGRNADLRFVLIILLDKWRQSDIFQKAATKWDVVCAIWTMSQNPTAPIADIGTGVSRFFAAWAANLFSELKKIVILDSTSPQFYLVNPTNFKIDPFLLDENVHVWTKLVKTIEVPQLPINWLQQIYSKRMPHVLGIRLSENAQKVFESAEKNAIHYAIAKNLPAISKSSTRTQQHSRKSERPDPIESFTSERSQLECISDSRPDNLSLSAPPGTKDEISLSSEFAKPSGVPIKLEEIQLGPHIPDVVASVNSKNQNRLLLLNPQVHMTEANTSFRDTLAVESSGYFKKILKDKDVLIFTAKENFLTYESMGQGVVVKSEPSDVTVQVERDDEWMLPKLRTNDSMELQTIVSSTSNEEFNETEREPRSWTKRNKERGKTDKPKCRSDRYCRKELISHHRSSNHQNDLTYHGNNRKRDELSRNYRHLNRSPHRHHKRESSPISDFYGSNPKEYHSTSSTFTSGISYRKRCHE